MKDVCIRESINIGGVAVALMSKEGGHTQQKKCKNGAEMEGIKKEARNQQNEDKTEIYTYYRWSSNPSKLGQFKRNGRQLDGWIVGDDVDDYFTDYTQQKKQ